MPLTFTFPIKYLPSPCEDCAGDSGIPCDNCCFSTGAIATLKMQIDPTWLANAIVGCGACGGIITTQQTVTITRSAEGTGCIFVATGTSAPVIQWGTPGSSPGGEWLFNIDGSILGFVGDFGPTTGGGAAGDCCGFAQQTLTCSTTAPACWDMTDPTCAMAIGCGGNNLVCVQVICSLTITNNKCCVYTAYNGGKHSYKLNDNNPNCDGHCPGQDDPCEVSTGFAKNALKSNKINPPLSNYELPAITPNSVEIEPKKTPLIVRALSKLRQEGDIGLGDVVQRYAAKVGGEQFKKIFKKIMGKDCGCADRQARLNKLHPFRA